MNKESIYYTLQNTDKKERETLKLLVLGYSNSEISKELGMAATTVEYRIKKLYQKFEVQNKRELMVLFLDDFVLKILNSPVL